MTLVTPDGKPNGDIDEFSIRVAGVDLAPKIVGVGVFDFESLPQTALQLRIEVEPEVWREFDVAAVKNTHRIVIE